MKKQIILAIAGASLLLGACGNQAAKGGKNDGKVAAKEGDDWDATNACAILDKAVLGEALNDNVTKTSLGLVSPESGPDAATSECTYKLASGGTATFMTRKSPIDDNTPEAIQMARKTTAESLAAFGEVAMDVPGLGKSAFYVPSLNQLNVFLDENRFVILTIGSAPPETALQTAGELIKPMLN